MSTRPGTWRHAAPQTPKRSAAQPTGDDAKRLRHLLKQACGFLSGGKGHPTPEQLNELRVGCGMEPLVVPGERDAQRVLVYLRSPPTLAEPSERVIAKQLGLGALATQNALDYLKRFGLAEATSPRSLRSGHWDGMWKATSTTRALPPTSGVHAVASEPERLVYAFLATAQCPKTVAGLSRATKLGATVVRQALASLKAVGKAEIAQAATGWARETWRVVT